MRQINKYSLSIIFLIFTGLFFAECESDKGELIGTCDTGIKVSIDNPLPINYIESDITGMYIRMNLKADDTLWHTLYYEAWLNSIAAHQGNDTIVYGFSGYDGGLLYTLTGSTQIKYPEGKDHGFSKLPYRLDVKDFLVIDRLDRYSTKFKWRKNHTAKERQISFSIQSGPCRGDVIITQEANSNPNPTTP